MERADGAPELLAGLGVIDREVERSLRAPDLLGGQQGPAERTEPGRQIVRPGEPPRRALAEAHRYARPCPGRPQTTWRDPIQTIPTDVRQATANRLA